MAGVVIGRTGFAAITLLRAGRCVIKNMKYVNEDAAVRFCQVFDASATANVTLGTTAPTWIMVAAQNGGNDDFVGELTFDNGIVMASTTTATGSTTGTTTHFFAVIE